MEAKRCIMFLSRSRKGWIGVGAVCVAVLAALLFPAFRGSGRQPRISAGLLAASEGLTEYDVTMRLMPESGEIALSETIRYRNGTGGALDDLVMRLWLNAFSTEESSPAAAEELFDACYPDGFSPGGVTLYDVTWNGRAAVYGFDDEAKTALRIHIPPLEDGETGELFLRCVAAIPACAYRSGRVGEDWQLGNVIPLVSRYENGAWRTDAYSAVGDPFLSDCANFTVALYGAADYAVACSAYLTRDRDGVWRGSIPAARDVALCLSRGGFTVSGWAGETKVISCAGTEAGAGRALDAAVRAVNLYAGLYGPYPYPTLTLCGVDFPFGGMEYPGLCMIGESNYLETRADSLELEIAHETAHQWFYALVGSDQANDPWQDEALCEYAMLRYVRQRYGQGSFESLKSYRVDAAMQEHVPGTLTPGSPIDYFGNLTDYRTVVYGRGAALLLALDALLPGGTDGFLRAYAGEFAYGFVSRKEFEDFLNRYAGMDLHPLLVDYLDTLL